MASALENIWICELSRREGYNRRSINGAVVSKCNGSISHELYRLRTNIFAPRTH